MGEVEERHMPESGQGLALSLRGQTAVAPADRLDQLGMGHFGRLLYHVPLLIDGPRYVSPPGDCPSKGSEMLIAV